MKVTGWFISSLSLVTAWLRSALLTCTAGMTSAARNAAGIPEGFLLCQCSARPTAVTAPPVASPTKVRQCRVLLPARNQDARADHCGLFATPQLFAKLAVQPLGLVLCRRGTGPDGGKGAGTPELAPPGPSLPTSPALQPYRNLVRHVQALAVARDAAVHLAEVSDLRCALCPPAPHRLHLPGHPVSMAETGRAGAAHERTLCSHCGPYRQPALGARQVGRVGTLVRDDCGKLVAARGRVAGDHADAAGVIARVPVRARRRCFAYRAPCALP